MKKMMNKFTAFAAFALAAAFGLNAQVQMAGSSANFYADDNGVWHVANAAGLGQFRDWCNAGTNYSGKTVCLDANIDLGNAEWEPIGDCWGDGFRGTFDGKGFTVSSFKVTTDKKFVGLFGVAPCCIVTNLTVEGATVIGINSVAAIVGHGDCAHIIDCTARNCTVTAFVKDNDDGDKVGAICGYLCGESRAEVRNCRVENCTITGYRDVGGAVGIANGGAEVYNTTVASATVINDRSVNYKGYTTDAAYDVNAIIGEITSTATIGTDNVADSVTVKVANFIAQVGSIKYEDLNEALTAAKAGGTCELLKDVALSGEWTPIAGFNGTFDGKGYTITGLSITKESTDLLGLFADAGSATIKDVAIQGATITATGGAKVGVLAGAISGANISNVKVINATIDTTSQYVGGLCGYGYPNSCKCEVAGCTIKGKDQVGGLIGYLWVGHIENSYVTNNMITATEERAGGLVGKIQIAAGNLGSSTMWVSGNVVSGTATAPDMAGGLFAQIMGDVDYYSIANNDIDVKCVAVAGSEDKFISNPIGNLRASQNAAFTGALEANITGNCWSDATLAANSFTYSNVASGVEPQVINRDNPSVIVETGDEESNEAKVVTKKSTAKAQTTSLPEDVATALAEQVTVEGKTTTISEQIEQTTKVEGVKLTTNETVVVASETLSGAQAVVSAAKLQAIATTNDTQAAQSEKAEAQTFAEKIVTAQTVEVKVEVTVVPTVYVKPAEETTGTMSFTLEPKATVKIIEDNVVAATQVVDVDNSMIDQTQPITVSLFTGFQPAQIVHRDDGGNVIDNFTGSDISYDSTTGIATVEISHFSTLTAYDAEVVDPLQPEGSTKVADGFYQNAATYGAATEFYITSKDGFHFFRNLINQENGAIDDYIEKGFYGSTADNFYTENPFKGKTVKLLCDVDEGDVAVKPIGMTAHSRADEKDKRYFYGIFDGCNHTVSNLRVIDDPPTSKHRVGLFGQVTRNVGVPMAGVVNLTVSNAVVSGYNYVGGFVGGLNGVVTLTNCHLTGSVTLTGTSSYVGGIVGHNGDSVDSQIVGCSVDVASGSTLTAKSQGGGIVGYMGGGDIIGCTLRGLAISASGSYVLGGIAGKFGATGCVAASNTVDSVTITAKSAGASGSIIGSFGAAGQTLIDNTVVNTHVYDPGPTEVFGQCHWFASDDTTTVIGWNSVGTLTAGGITGGTFERLPTSYLASGCELVAQGTTPETYVVQEAAPSVCKIGDNEYTSLAAAIDAVEAGDEFVTIQMIADEAFTGTNPLTIAAGKKIVLDLNGKTLSYVASNTDADAFITNKGDLTVTDTSADKDGKITAKQNTDPSWSYGCYTIDNAGTYDTTGHLVVNAGTIENTSGSGLAWPINNGWWGTKADCVISGGTIHSANYVPVRQYYQYGGCKTMTISGGTFVADNSRAIAVQFCDATVQETESYVRITGGTFTCNGSGTLYMDLHEANVDTTGANITVSGGTFTNSQTANPLIAYDDEGKDQTSAVLLGKIISGGTFSADPTAWVAEGYEAAYDSETGKWGVVEATPVAQIAETGVKYASFGDAVQAVAEGQTIKALCDFTIPSSEAGGAGKVVAKVSYTFDGDGHTITCEDATEWDWDADGKVVTFDNVTIVGGRTNAGGTFYFMNSRFTNGTTIDCYQLYTYRNTCYVDATSRLIGRTEEFHLRKGFVVVGADDFNPAVATTAKTNSTAQLYTKRLGMRENGVLALTNANVTAEQDIRSNSVKTKYSDIIATNSLIEIGRSVEYVSEGYKLGIWCPNALPNGRGDMTLAASQRVDLVSCVLRGARNLTNAGLFVAKNTSIEFGNDFTNTGDFTLDGSSMAIGTDFTGPATSGYTGNFVNNGTIFLKNGATLSYVNKAASTGTITVSGSTVALENVDIKADETMSFDATSKITFNGTWSNAGSVSFDLDGETGDQYLLVRNDGEATPDVAEYNISLTNADGYELKVVEGSLYAVMAARTIEVTPETVQDALDSAKKGDTIVLKAGDYGVLYLRNNGTDTTRVFENITIKAKAGDAVTVEQIAYQQKSGKYFDVENLTIDGFTFDNPSLSGVYFDCSGAGCLRVNGLLIENCSKTGNNSSGSDYGMYTFASFQYDSANPPTVFAGDTSLECGYHNIQIVSNAITKVYMPIAFQNGGLLDGLTVVSNVFTECTDNHIQKSGVLAKGSYVITDNTIIGMTGRFARISGATSDMSVTVTNNTVIAPLKYDTGNDGSIFKVTGAAGFTVKEEDNDWNDGEYKDSGATYIAQGDTSLLPIAQVTIGGVTTKYNDLHTALEAAKASGAVCELLSDVTLTGNWTPVTDFAGTFDGKGFTITGLNIEGEGNLGLFANVANAVVKNLTIDGAKVTSSTDGAKYIGVLAGRVSSNSNGFFSNVTVVAATVTSAGKYVGGIAGDDITRILDSQVLNSSITGKELVGGFTGFMWGGYIQGCTATGNTVVATANRAGGLVGRAQFYDGNDAQMWVNDNVVSGKVNSPSVAGGLIGLILSNDGDNDSDTFEIRNNTIDVTFTGTTTATNPIAVLSDGQGATFTSALAAKITGNWWEDKTLDANSFQYTNVGESVAAQTIYRGVAMIGETCYKTFAAAVDYVKANAMSRATIKLLSNCTVSEAIDLPSAVKEQLTIDGTNSVDSGYYTMTVTGEGSLAWNGASGYKQLNVKANLTDARTSGSGLYLSGYNRSYLTVYGDVVASTEDTIGFGNFYGNMTGGVYAPALSQFFGSVTAAQITNGQFRGSSVVAPAKSITGGQFYNADALTSVAASLADGYTLIRYVGWSSSSSYSYVDLASKVVCTLKHGDDLINYTAVSSANTEAVEGDTVTVVANLSSAPVKLGVPLIVKSGVTVTTVSAEASTCKVTGPVVDGEGNSTYTAVTLTVDDAETKAYVVSGDTTNCYNAVKSAVSAGVAGDKVYLKDDYEGTLYPKTGTELYLNGHTVTAVAANLNDAVVKYDEGADKWVARLRTADDEDAIASVDYTSDGKLHYFATLAKAFSAVSSGTTVTLLKDISIGDSDYSGSYMIGGNWGQLNSGKTINGDGHTLTYTGTKTPCLVYKTCGSITNMTFAGMRNAIVNYAYDGATFDQVKISGTPADVINNFGAFAANLGYGSTVTVTFRNCEMAMNVAAQGARSFYNSAFVGWSNYSATLNFENCKVTGSVVCGTASMFIANFKEGEKVTLNVTDTYNEGLIQAIYPATETGDAYAFNPVVAVTWASQLPNLTLNLSQGGVEKTYTGVDQLTSDELFAALKRNNGLFLNGSLDATLALAKNDQGGFAATTATNADAAKYVISVGLYAGLTLNESSAGSSFVNVTETITTDQHGVKVLPTIMNYRFVDAKWVAANPTAVVGTLCGNKTYTLGDETFYYVEEDAGDYLKRTLDGQPTAAECYSISAYDANGTLLHSAVISADAYALTASAKASDEAVTYLYDTLEAAVQNVEQGGTVTVLADNSESFTAAPKSGVTAFTVDNTADYEIAGTITTPAGYTFKDNGDGTWSYQQAVVAQIVLDEGATTNTYDTLTAAIEDVKNGQTIEILVNQITLPTTFYNTKSFTIEGLEPVAGVLQTTVTQKWTGDHNSNTIGPITFKNIDFAVSFTDFHIGTSADDVLTFDNCDFTGPEGVTQMWGPGKVVLTGCDFNITGTYSASRTEKALHVESTTGVAIEATDCYFASKLNSNAMDSTATFTGCVFDGGVAESSGDYSGKYIAEIKLRSNVAFTNCVFTEKFAAGLASEYSRDDNGINIVNPYTYSFVGCSIEDSTASVYTLVKTENLGSTSKAEINVVKDGDGKYTGGVIVTKLEGDDLAALISTDYDAVKIADYTWTVVKEAFTVTFAYGTDETTVAARTGYETAAPSAMTIYKEKAWELPTITAGIDYDGEKYTFLGWEDEHGYTVRKEIKASDAITETLYAKFSEIAIPTDEPSGGVIQVVAKEGETEKTKGIVVSKEWVKENVESAATTGEATASEINTELEKVDPNGLKKWQNYVLGTKEYDGVATNVISDAAQTDDATKIAVVPNINPKDNTGFTVKYELQEVSGAMPITTVAASKIDDLQIDLTTIEKSAKFKVNVVLTPEGSENGETIASTNTIGVLKTAATSKQSLLSVPWAGLDGKRVTVANLVKTANLTAGDKIYAFDDDYGDYYSWTLKSDKTWEADDIDVEGESQPGPSADDYLLKRGISVWIERSNTSVQVCFYGQDVEDEATAGDLKAESEIAEKTGSASWNLVASPSVDDLALTNDKLNGVGDGSITPTVGDQIQIPTDTTPVNYKYVKGKGWCYQEVTIVGGVARVVWTPVTDEQKISAGQGFWYLNKGGQKKISW